MTQEEKVFERAQNFVNNHKEIEVYTFISDMPKILVEYLQNEVDAGRIKFTAKREED